VFGPTCRRQSFGAAYTAGRRWNRRVSPAENLQAPLQDGSRKSCGAFACPVRNQMLKSPAVIFSSENWLHNSFLHECSRTAALLLHKNWGSVRANLFDSRQQRLESGKFAKTVFVEAIRIQEYPWSLVAGRWKLQMKCFTVQIEPYLPTKHVNKAMRQAQGVQPPPLSTRCNLSATVF